MGLLHPISSASHSLSQHKSIASQQGIPVHLQPHQPIATMKYAIAGLFAAVVLPAWAQTELSECAVSLPQPYLVTQSFANWFAPVPTGIGRTC